MSPNLSRRDLALLAAITLMWGINWPMMKLSLGEITPLWFRAVTMSGGTFALLLYFRARGTRFAATPAQWLQVAWLALPNILAWHGFSILGLMELASGRAAILGFTMPVWTVLIGVLLGSQRMTARVWVSVVGATAAVALLSAQELAALAGRPIGVLWMQLAAIGWAAGTVLMRRTALTLPTETVTVGMMAMGSVFFWIVAPLAEPVPVFSGFSTVMWVSLVYGVFINYGYAQVIWFGMARRLPPSASAFSIMAVPLVGTLGATAIVGEVPHFTDWLAAGCVMLAIAAALLPARASPSATTR